MGDMIGLVDMDGTVADLDSAMQKGLAKLASPGEPTFTHGDDLPDWMEARRRLVMMQPGFWRNLHRLELGFEIVQCLEHHDFNIHVLTKGPSNKPLAWSEKVEWCREHLPQANVTITEDKSHYYGKTLVDDWLPYGLPWLKHRKRGLLIVPAQPWNVDAETLHPNIFRYDGSNKARLRAVVKAAKDRQDKEPYILPPL